jgi:peptidoglycan/LPS O-acetylase OafA/YrhL
VGGTNSNEPLSRLTAGQLTFGAVAVDAFFTISGFLVTKSWLRSRGARDYLSKRIERIYPAFIVVILLQQFLITPLISQGTASAFAPTQIVLTVYRCVDLAAFPYNGTQPQVFTANPLKYEPNGALWTIRYEFCCYVLVLLIGLAGLYLRPHWLVLGFGTSVAASAMGLVPPWHRALTAIFGSGQPWPRFLSFYLAGMLFFLYRTQIPKSGWLASLAVLLIIISRFITHGLNVALPTAGAYLLFWVAFHDNTSLTQFGRHGDFSYGTYLYGFLIGQLLIYNFPSLRSPWKLFALGWPLAIIAGFLSWHGVEKHFLRRKRVQHVLPDPVLSNSNLAPVPP